LNEARQDLRWTRPDAFSLVAGLAGLIVAGPVGFAVGLVAGMFAARRAEVVVLAAASALLITAAFTVIEEPLTEGRIFNFPNSHPIAEVAAKVAAVLLVAGLIGLSAHRDRTQAPRSSARELEDVSSLTPIPTIVAVLAAALLGAFVLWQLGDQRWRSAAPVVAILVITLAGWLVHARRRQSSRGR